MESGKIRVVYLEDPLGGRQQSRVVVILQTSHRLSVTAAAASHHRCQLLAKPAGLFAFHVGPGGQRGARHEHGPLKQTLRQRRHQVEADRSCACRKAHQGDAPRVAAERADVVADPAHRQLLVPQAEVAGSLGGTAASENLPPREASSERHCTARPAGSHPNLVQRWVLDTGVARML